MRGASTLNSLPVHWYSLILKAGKGACDLVNTHKIHLCTYIHANVCYVADYAELVLSELGVDP